MSFTGFRPSFMTTAMWFTWLLRGDIRAGRSVDDTEAHRAFVSWWLLFGPVEYPEVWWYGPDQVDVAMAAPSALPGRRLPALLLLLHRARHDLQDHFNLNDPEQLANYLCWYRLYAPGQLLAAPPLPPWAIAITEAASRRYSAPTVPRMALALWSRLDELRRVIDLKQPAARRGLRDWYLTNSTSFIPPPSRLPAGFEIRPIRRTPARNLANSSVSLIGFARAEFGIGEDVRLLSRALEATTIKHTITDVRTGTTIRTQDESRLGWLAPPSQGINVFCMTAFDTAERFLKCGLQAFNNNYNIGYWPWELPRFPSKWDDVYGLMDEVWTSTRFQSHAYEANGAVPVFLMPPAITPALNRMPPKLPGALRRSFCFIYVFDPNSTLARKNPRAAILAFQRAFPHSDRTVRFVLRVNGRLAGRPGARALLAAVARDRRVTISEGTLSRKDSQRFLQQADCFVSPHRAEGFGRNVAEAIAYGVPVLATAFSGTSDFLLKHERIASKPKQVRDGEYPHAEGLRWCEPDIRQLAAKMQSVRRRRPRIRQIVYLRRARLLLQHYSLQAAGRRYRQALDRINGIAGSS